MACQYKFKNGTLCGTNSHNQIYCDGHTVIMLQDHIAALEAECENSLKLLIEERTLRADDTLQSIQREKRLRDERDALQSRADAAAGLAGALQHGINSLEVAVAAGLEGFSDEDTKEIVKNHRVLVLMRAALAAHKQAGGG
jgi:hypothetical protein